MADITVRRVDFGYFVRPAEETGTGSPRVEPCLGYLIGHPHGTVLFDTGLGSHPDADAHYRPRRIGLHEALAVIGTDISDIGIAANCQPLPAVPGWIEALQQLDPRMVYFAHDRSVWTP